MTQQERQQIVEKKIQLALAFKSLFKHDPYGLIDFVEKLYDRWYLA